MAFYAVELVLKFTADEQKNEPLFNVLCDFLQFLDEQTSSDILNLGLAKFKIGILEVSGLGMQNHKSDLFLKLKNTSFNQLKVLAKTPRIMPLQESLSQFIEYQLERRVKSESYLNMV